MPWFWTDDLARLLVEAGLAHAGDLAAWSTSPVAVRSDSDNALAVAEALVGEERAPPESDQTTMVA